MERGDGQRHTTKKNEKRKTKGEFERTFCSFSLPLLLFLTSERCRLIVVCRDGRGGGTEKNQKGAFSRPRCFFPLWYGVWGEKKMKKSAAGTECFFVWLARARRRKRRTSLSLSPLSLSFSPLSLFLPSLSLPFFRVLAAMGVSLRVRGVLWCVCFRFTSEVFCVFWVVHLWR